MNLLPAVPFVLAALALPPAPVPFGDAVGDVLSQLAELPDGPPVSTPTGADITAEDLRLHVGVLADDAMEGRETGSKGGVAAARYIAAVFRQAGLEGAGDDGGYLQRIDHVGFALASMPTLGVVLPEDWAPEEGDAVEAGPHDLVLGVDFDYVSGGSVSGRFDVVVVTSEEEAAAAQPRSDAALFLYGSWRSRSAWLESMGAPEGRGWGLMLLPGWPTAGEPREGLPRGLGSSDTTRPTTLRVRGPWRAAFSQGAPASLTVSVEAGEATPAYNVVARVAGVGTPERPELADEVIVFTGHYDHIGMAASGEDRIYNGADDDASGVAAVLELAEAFAAGEPPARTLLFMAVTGEERGLLGTRYYMDNPIEPLEDTIYNLNFEMVGRPDELAGGAGRLWLAGYERTNLGAAWTEAGLPISPDKRPDQNFFMRSDNMAFVERGVVGQTLSSFALHEEYHTVADEADTLDYAHMETALVTSYQAARSLSDGELTPAWTPGGNPFEED